MTVTIKCTTPKGYEITIPFYDYDPDGDIAAWFEDLASFDAALASRGFKPLPLLQSGGGNWNKGGKSNMPRNWIDVKDNTLYVFFGWHGANVEENNAYKKGWQEKITEATGVFAEVDKTSFGKDAKDRDIWTFTYPIKVGVKLLEVLPESEFERKPALVERLAKAKKG